MKNFKIIRRTLAVLLSMVMACSMAGVSVSAEGLPQATASVAYTEQQDGFQIENGVLVSYTGNAEHVVIPDGVTKIGGGAFHKNQSLVSVHIPDSVTEIGELAFESCYNLAEVTLPSQLKTIGKNAFINTIWGENNPTFVVGTTLFGSGYAKGHVVIPKEVTKIGDNAFFGCDQLTSVAISDTVTSIGNSAFMYCYDLSYVDLPNSITNIESEAFVYCMNLKSITIPEGVTVIKQDTFDRCGNLIDVTIPNSVTRIEDRAFSSCGFESFSIPDSVVFLGEEAFSFCNDLISIEIPDSVTQIEEAAFSYCGKLNSVELPNKLTEIKGYTFIECTSLTDVFIPPSVTTIAPNSFKDCTNLSATYGYVGSYAETFAAENNYQFVGFQEPYEDVTFDDWFFLAVESMYNTGLMTGTTPTTFDPAVPMNRAQFATVLYRLAGEPEVEYAPYYPDVPDGWFYSDAITWATEYGIITGYDDGNFGTQVNITREQIVTLLYRFANCVGLDTSQRVSLDEYVDGNSVSGFAKDAMEWALAVGIIQGQNNQGIIDPQGESGRAVGATIFMRFLLNFSFQ